jgi:hypothetical protein
LTGVRRGKTAGFFSLDKDGPELLRIVRDTGAMLVIVDPLSAHLGRCDSYKDAEVRQALAPLVSIGQETGACILGVRHLSKMEARSALYRGGGSIAFIGVARGALLLGRHPDDDTRRVVAVSKTNLSAEAQSWSFKIAVDEKKRPFVSWDQYPVEVTAERLVQAMDERGKPAGEDPDTSMGRAVAFLREALAKGSRPTKEIEEEAREVHCIPARTLDRARTELGVSARIETGETDGKKWKRWALFLSEKDAKDANNAKETTPEPLASLSGSGAKS